MTAIDSNVLIDLIGEPNAFTGAAVRVLNERLRLGALVICPVVAAEIAHYYGSPEKLRETLSEMRLEIEDFSMEALHRAGTAYVNYCRRSPKPRARLLADFLVGAHAAAGGHPLVTRDRGYYRTYFRGLTLIEPQP